MSKLALGHRPVFDIKYAFEYLRDDLVVTLDLPVLFAKDVEVTEIRFPLSEPESERSLVSAVMARELGKSKSQIWQIPPRQHDGDYVALLERQLERAQAQVDALLKVITEVP